MRLLIQSFAICFGGAALGLLLNLASASPTHLLKPVFPAAASGIAVCSASPEIQHRGHGHKTMPQREAVQACGSCAVGFVDARGAAAYAQGHIPGAIHLPPSGHSGEALALTYLRQYPTVVIYDAGGGCGLAEGVADRLAAEGLNDVRILEGSWTEWQSAGGPAQSGACHACSQAEDGDRAKPAENRKP
jgi:rhodanese-related sulfurtransferase